MGSVKYLSVQYLLYPDLCVYNRHGPHHNFLILTWGANFQLLVIMERNSAPSAVIT